MSRDSGPWLIYALGGGWGHLTRAAALARAAQSRHQVRILTNSPYAARVAGAMPELDLISLDPSLGAEETRKLVVRHITSSNPRCLIVDTFPRGLGGELADVLDSLPLTKVLVHRDLAPRYVAEFRLREFVRAKYQLVLIPGESEAGAFADHPAVATTQPWLIREPQPKHPRGKRVLVCASGNDNELAWYGAVVGCLLQMNPKIDIRCIAPTCPRGCRRDLWIEHWPAVDLYPSAAVVIGSAGYNTVYECEAFQVPLIARPWPRMYDRQWHRARRAAQRTQVTIVKDAAEAAKAAILQIGQVGPAGARIENGAPDAVRRIEQELVDCLAET